MALVAGAAAGDPFALDFALCCGMQVMSGR